MYLPSKITNILSKITKSYTVKYTNGKIESVFISEKDVTIQASNKGYCIYLKGGPIYLNDLNIYVFGMENITKNQLVKIFKKEKKLKIPNLDIKDKKLVYLGWIDEATKKLLITYNLNGNLLGMSCRLTESKPNSSNICTLCNHIGNSAEVGFVSPICKPKNQDDYKSLGFYICLNSDECNERITSTEKLETLIKIVNRLD